MADSCNFAGPPTTMAAHSCLASKALPYETAHYHWAVAAGLPSGFRAAGTTDRSGKECQLLPNGQWCYGPQWIEPVTGVGRVTAGSSPAART